MNTIPVSLRNPELMAVWKTARQQLDRHGHERRGTVRMPTLSDSSSLALSSLLGKRLTARLDLNQLEQALQLQGIGRDLDDALALLGMPPSKARAAERAKNERRRAARDAAEAYVADWLEAWSGEWLNWLFQSGQMVHEDAESVSQLMQLIRALLDRRLQAKGDLLARNDLAVSICGSAHALDDGALVERCTRRALWHTLDQQPAYRDGRDVWVMAGILPDQVSAPVLTWHLPLQPESELGKLCAAAHSVSVPLHLTLMALMKHDIVISNDSLRKRTSLSLRKRRYHAACGTGRESLGL